MARLNMAKIQPAAYKAMGALDSFVANSGIDPLQREMIRIRASQINGCAYCVNLHSQDALKLGEKQQRIFLINVWREAGTIFSEEDKLILAITEEITRIQEKGLSDDLYDRAIQFFGEEKTAQIIMAIVTINAWNRIGVSLHMHPPVQP